MNAALLFIAAALPFAAHARAVNLSSVWVLPEEGYPVFYRYFRDRITWYEAEAVCQFHHAQLLTVDSSGEFDAARAYLKELDVVNLVWTGLKRAGPNAQFMWPESRVMESEGYWLEELPKSEEALCAAIDPASDFRWLALPCSGPQAAAFLCQMQVPGWAAREDGCMLTSLPSLTVTFLPEQGAIELVSDCGLEGTRRIACKGQANHEEMMKQLSCESSTEAASSDTWEEGEQQPTRHRRESEVTSELSPTLNATTPQGIVGAEEETTTNPSATSSTTPAPTTTTTASTPTTTTAATTPVRTTMRSTTSRPTTTTVAPEETTKGSKPLPPALRGNAPLLPLLTGTGTGTGTGTQSSGSTSTSRTTPPSPSSSFSSSSLGRSNTTSEPESHETFNLKVGEVPERPNRARLLLRPHHHSFYPYFLNRVLG